MIRAPVYRIRSEPIAFRNYTYFTEISPFGANYKAACQECGNVIKGSRIDHPAFEYQGGILADFYSGVGFLLISDSAMQEIKQHFMEVGFAPVRVLRPPKNNLGSIFEVRPQLNLEFSETFGNLKALEVCPLCKRHSYEFSGVWSAETYSTSEGEMAYREVPPEIESGVGFPRALIGNATVFSLDTNFLFCTDVFREYCVKRAFKNIMFLRYGCIE